MISPDYPEEVRLLLHKNRKGNVFCSLVIYLGPLIVLCPIMVVNGKMQLSQPEKYAVTRNSNPHTLKVGGVGVKAPDRPFRPSQVLTEAEGS